MPDGLAGNRSRRHGWGVIEALLRKPLRWVMSGLQDLRRAFWHLRRSETYGVHGVPMTPDGKVVFVKLRYARGWRLPGGGRGKNEDPAGAVLRELKEEIGLVSHGAVEPVRGFPESMDRKRDTVSLFIVRDVEYRPRWSLEIESITEAGPDRPPANLAAPTRRWLALARPML